MSADPASIERIRSATFDSGRRGYKKQDVDRFLASLADWLESGAGREQSVVVKEALQDVGRRTGRILTTAEESAQEIREQAQKVREESDAYANQTREQADQRARALKESSEAEAERTRTVAARDAEELTSKARTEVRAIEEAGTTRKAEINTEIEELRKRRGSIIEHLDQLAVQLSGTANDHRPSGNTDEMPAVKPSSKAEAPAENGEGKGEANGEGLPAKAKAQSKAKPKTKAKAAKAG